MVQVLLVATGAFFGAGARLFVIERVGRRYDAAFPYALLVANLSGSFAIGVIATLITERFSGNRDASLLLTTGFLGAFTTFSSFSYDTIRLLENGAVRPAMANVLVSLVGGIVLALAGVLLVLAVF